MNKFAALLLLLPITVMADPIDGVWQVQLSSFKLSGKPDAYLLSDGTFSCLNCSPTVRIKADGVPHGVKGHHYYDAVAVRVIGPNSVEETDTLAGKQMSSENYTVSPDGMQLTIKWTNSTAAQTVVGTQIEKRVAAGPPGSHALSGSWQYSAITNFPDFARFITYRSTPDGLRMSWNGRSYDAKFDGKDYPMSNDPGHTMVSLKKLGPRAIQETDKHAGKVTEIVISRVSADGKTLSVVDKDLEGEQTQTYTMERQ